jgi:cold shock CspA family protein
MQNRESKNQSLRHQAYRLPSVPVLCLLEPDETMTPATMNELETIQRHSPMSDITRYTGTVVAYRRSGYGWLDWEGHPVWIHIMDVRDHTGHLLPVLKVGQQVLFTLTESPKGYRARNATVLAVKPTTTEDTSHERQE